MCAHAEAVRPCFLRKRPHGKDGCESRCRIGSIVLVFRIERMTGFEPAVSCLGSRRAATAPHPRRGRRGPLSAYPIAGARRLDVTSFLGMSALTRGGMPHVVEPAGFEPATFPLRTGRPATGRRPRNAPDGIRTRNLTIRGRTLCPIGLRGRASAHATACVPARAGMGNGSWRWHGPGRGRRKYPSRMPSFPRAERVRRRVRAAFTP